jgi:hypothetical protein
MGRGAAAAGTEVILCCRVLVRNVIFSDLKRSHQKQAVAKAEGLARWTDGQPDDVALRKVKLI